MDGTVSEQLETRLSAILGFLDETARQQSPILVDEYLRWGRWDAIQDIFYFGAIAAVGLFLMWLCIRRISWDIEIRIFGGVIGAFLLAFGVSGVRHNCHVLYKVTNTPRVYLLEEAAKLIHK